MERLSSQSIDKKKGMIVIKRKSFIKKGENITDFYEIESRQLGSGTYGLVKRGIHKVTGQERALKIIPRTKIKNIERFRNEVEILRTVDHPHIVKLYEWYEDSKNVYLVMEICKGGELFDRITDYGHFTESQAAFLFKQILSALNYCHAMKICHRDLKPENFLFETKKPDSSLKLIDFGLSKVFEDPKIGFVKMKTRAGTPYYIAPEVIQGNYDVSCDMWSAGVILYILLCGYPPFYGNNDPEILDAVRNGYFEYDGEEWDDVSNEAKDLINKMLTKPKIRLTAEGALKHTWIKTLAGGSGQILSVNNRKMLKSFTASQKLKKAVLTYIATQCTEKEVEGLKSLFISLDKNGDGKLSMEELKVGLKGTENEEELMDIMTSVDTDGSGDIDYTEFLAATIDTNLFLQENKLMNAFNMFDKDKSGKISAEEIKDIIGAECESEIDEQVWKELVKEADIDGDGEIDFKEFMAMMYTFKEK